MKPNMTITAKEWFKPFKDGDLPVEIKPKILWPSSVNHNVLKQKIEENSTSNTSSFSGELGLYASIPGINQLRFLLWNL